ncbi:MAG: DNA mismatch repair endonuclease MutL [Clostridiales bacterium]|nr:DNA mismatch repair endonuclease MutL [Clostridiales bacterium]
MGRINVLDSRTANAIKAGEVIERPVSVVKELLDNAVDSGANRIKIEFAGGGISLIRVTDNGCGMDREDAQKAFLIHATSKLKTIEDLYDLSTMGFRGEALASIASCADVVLTTSQSDDETGTRVAYEDGNLKDVSDASAPQGTCVEVRNLFKNIPARYKFLKKDSTEGMYITGLVEKLCIINPQISVKLVKDGAVQFTTPGTGDIKDAVYAVYGKETANNLVPVKYEMDGMRIEGFTGLPRFVRGNRGLQCVYVNDRIIHSKTVSAAIDEAYKNAVMKNKFPICFLMIYCAPGNVDVNVHPQKAEVKFSSDSDVFRLVYHGIREAITSSGTAGGTFNGIASAENVEIETPVETKVAAENRQLRYDISAGGKLSTSHKLKSAASPVSQTAGDAASANELLKILSGFKPDASVVANGSSEEKAEELQTPVLSEPLTIAPVTPEEVRKEQTDIDKIAGARFTGILFNTYIILQTTEECYFVDQHAAHERVLYEEFMAKKAPGKNVPATEHMLVPSILKVSASDYAFIEGTLDKFTENGFELELLGDREIALRAVPMGSANKASDMFSEILTDLKRDNPAKTDIWYSLIQTTACKAAIRAGDVITQEQAESLIEKLTKLEDPYHCAHGRPTFFCVSRRDFEKNFKRIV